VIALQFFWFRIKQIYRAVKDAGWLHVVILLPFAVVLGLMILDQMQHARPVWKILMVLGLPIWLFFSRTDRYFLRLITAKAPFIFAAEYIFLAALVGIPSWLLTSDYAYIYPIIPVGLLALIPSFSFRKKWIKPLPIADILPVSHFEFRAMLRSQWLFYILLILVLLAGREFFILVLLSGWLTSLLISGSYYFYEPIDLFRSRFRKQGDAVFTMISHGLTIHVMLAPFFLVMWWLHADYLYVLIYFHVVVLLQWTFCLFYKYGTYNPNYSHVPSQIPIALFISSLLIPFILPVTLFYWIRYLFKYFHNIRFYAA
jgi:hypothetical protein